MLRSSIPIGRFFGVDLRMHISFPLVLALCILLSESVNGGAARGVALWLALCFAVFVRETARALAAAYIGAQLYALFLLPVGGIMAFAGTDPESDTGANRRLLMLSGPLANLFIGLLLMGTAYALEPKVSLFALPWIDTSHILRSFVWLQLMLGALSLLPMPSVAANRNAARKPTDAADATPAGKSSRKSFPIAVPRLSLGVLVAFAIIVIGLVLMNLWLVILGAFMMLGVIISRPPALSGPDAESILVSEVMLTEYTLLSSSDTLRGALDRTVHSLQDVFPVVRGDQLVGSIARQTIASRLLAEGDSYLQGIMTKTLQLANPSEKLVEALRRTASLGASEFIPVVEDGAMVGILTPQSLGRAVQHIKLSRPTPDRENARD
jgi:CBS domain-containing protein/Zn-dependent protease